MTRVKCVNLSPYFLKQKLNRVNVQTLVFWFPFILLKLMFNGSGIQLYEYKHYSQKIFQYGLHKILAQDENIPLRPFITMFHGAFSTYCIDVA